MTREQCENIILCLMKTIRDVYHEYNPEGQRLSMSIGENVSVNNCYWNEDREHQLNVTLFPDGDIGRYTMDENGETHTEYCNAEEALRNAG